MLVGIFDSGIGGLGVLHEAVCALPDARFLFYADREHVPYGEKSEAEILSFSEDITSFLAGKGCDAIVIACNTATSVAAGDLREHYRGRSLPILGMEPAVKPALSFTEGRVLVIATPVTAREHKLHALIDRLDVSHRVDVHPMPRLVQLAESSDFDGEAASGYISRELSRYADAGVGALVLGCTHFNYFAPQLSGLFGEGTALFDGNDGTVRQLARLLDREPATGPDGSFPEDSFDESRITYFDSGREVTDPGEKALFTALHRRFTVSKRYIYRRNPV